MRRCFVAMQIETFVQGMDMLRKSVVGMVCVLALQAVALAASPEGKKYSGQTVLRTPSGQQVSFASNIEFLKGNPLTGAIRGGEFTATWAGVSQRGFWAYDPNTDRTQVTFNNVWQSRFVCALSPLAINPNRLALLNWSDVSGNTLVVGQLQQYIE